MSHPPPSAQRHPTRPAIQQRSESLLPPHESNSITSIPVTPGISQGTYGKCPSGVPTSRHPHVARQEYFSSQLDPVNEAQPQPSPASPLCARLPLISRLSQLQLGDIALSGTVISATFPLPQSIQYRKEGTWKISEQARHCSAHLDSLAYLSSEECPWDHRVIAWTGEVYRASGDMSPSHNDLQASISAPGHTLSDEEAATKEIFVNNENKAKLEEMLDNSPIRTLPVWLADDRDVTHDGIKLKQQSRWRRYAEHDLHALFHYKQHPPTDGRKADRRWEDYRRMNKAYADRICQIYQPGDIVMIHGYYLMLVPELLRQRHPDIHIIFYLESPFPTSELVRCLHRREQILNGMLGSNLVCFQAFHYAQHFANSCARILGYSANSKWVETTKSRVHMSIIPLGISISKITSLAFAESVDKKYKELRELFKGVKVIIGCDPMDQFGGVDKKLQAFDCFLGRYPKWQQKTVLLQVTNPATMKDDDGESVAFARRVNQLADAINQDYGSLDFTPVQMHAQNLSQDEYFALLRLGDVAINTCIREGMSTTSLEYLACQRDSHGPLIISEFSGTASNLEEAIRINPWDVFHVADQINEALTLAPERRNYMHKALYKRVVEDNVEICVNSMLRRLIKVVRLRESGH
ncbi:trehalose 6-phosphate synthase/phosphatase [Trichoderma asperellum]|nr:glycosyltransferase family 20 protein [Trichoderma asperelloides]